MSRCVWKVLFLIMGMSISLLNYVRSQSITFDNVPPLTAGGNTSGGVCFNFTTNQAVVLEYLRCNLNTTTGTATIWYKPTKINGQPTISAAGGWTNLGSTTVTGVASTSNNVLTTIPVLLNLNVNPNDTIGLAIQWTGNHFPTTNVNTPTFTNGVVTMIADASCAYAYTSAMTTFYTPRQINGGVIYKMARKYPNDAAVAQLVSPSMPACMGTSPVTVAIRNDGTNVINTVRVNWSIDNVLQTPVTLTNPLDTNGGTGVNQRNVTLGNLNLTGPAMLRIWTSNVNNAVDSNTANDSLHLNLDPSMGGNYTINSAVATGGTNFQSINDFTTALQTRGVCAPVVATIAPNSGPYTGKVTIGNITGASAVNTIRLLGNGATVNVATTSTAGAKEMLLLNGARYVTVDSINFVSTSTTDGWAALISNNSLYDSIVRCKFDLTSITATASASNSGIMIQNSNTTATGGGIGGNYIYIGKNHILGANGTGGCYYGIAVATGGNHNNIIEGNRVENYFYYGIWASAVENLKIIGNEIVRPNKSASIGIHNAIYVTGACPDMLIDANRIHSNGVLTATGWSSFYGIRSLADGTATRPVVISNNALYSFKGTSLWLFYINGAEHNKIINNTVEFNVNTGSNIANYAYYFTGTNTGTEFINNIASFSTGGTGNKFGFYYSAATAAPDVSEMNNFSMRSTNTGTQYYGYFGANYATRAAFIAAYPTREINSPDVDPQYVNAANGNLMPTNAALINTGLPVGTYITKDIRGVIRPTNPTIGAFEKEPDNFNDLSMLVFSNPKDPFCAGSQDVYAVVQNAGINTINSFNIGWSVNNANQTPRSITRTLVPNNVQGVNIDTFLLGTVNIANATTIKAWTYGPNGGVDTSNTNDTISKLFTPTSFTLVANSDTVCLGASVTLNVSVSNNAVINPGDIEWYTSTNGTTWNLVPNQNQSAYVHNNINSSLYFKARFIANGSNCETNSEYVFTTPVSVVSIKGDTVCANESAVLIARANNGNTIKWYADSTATTPLHIGDTFEISGLTTNTRIWAEASLANLGCASPRVPTTVYVSTTPSVNLGNDITGCYNEGEWVTIDAGNPGALYTWDNNYNGRIRVVDRSGTYSVIVSNVYGCSDTDTVVVTMKPNPISALGMDTSVCIDHPITLDAGNDGVSYFWNTGQSTSAITAQNPGSYVVFITGRNGCLVSDTINVIHEGNLPTFDGIQIRNQGIRKFQFNSINPQYVIGYEWDFGDGSPKSFAASPVHEYTTNGNFLVTCYVSSSCGVMFDTMTVHILSTGIDEIQQKNVKIYPNPTTKVINVEAADNVTIESIQILNVLGQVVIEKQAIQASTTSLDLANIQSGNYMIMMHTNKGIVTAKFVKID